MLFQGPLEVKLLYFHPQGQEQALHLLLLHPVNVVIAHMNYVFYEAHRDQELVVREDFFYIFRRRRREGLL